MVATSTKARKEKARLFQQHCCSIIRAHFPEIMPGDLESTGMGQQGVDIRRHGQYVKDMLPFKFECKRHESITGFWDWWKQAVGYECEDKEKALLLFKKNHGDVMVAMRFNDFCEIQRKAWEKK